MLKIFTNTDPKAVETAFDTWEKSYPLGVTISNIEYSTQESDKGLSHSVLVVYKVKNCKTGVLR